MANVSGYVLAGGESSRMQGSGLPRDKALLPLHDGNMLLKVLRTVREVCGTATILCGTPERGVRLETAGRTLVDNVPRCGPLGGLEAALRDAATEWLLVVPVDLPLLPPHLLQALIEQGTHDGPGVAYFQAAGRRQPLPVLLHRTTLPVITEALAGGERKLMPVLQRAGQTVCPKGLRMLTAEEFADQQDVSQWFTNVNTPDDYRAARELVAEGNGFRPGASE